MASNVLRRSFSTSNVSLASQLIKTPVQVHGIEGRYAAALYSAAHKSNNLETVDKDLKTVREILKENPKFRDFVLDPTLKATKKKATVTAIAQKLSLSKESANFLGLLADNGRLNKLDAVISSFESVMRAHRGELFVQVTSAEALSKSHEGALNDALSKLVKKGQKVTITYNVKPSIVGGLIVNIGDKYVDLSIASRIKKYKEVLNSAV
ncbi:atp-3 [Pristionchus pacificus]|uniref:ATP synthase peripheral stalk subunit OSCP, mitochondrial n=1 Tax=Pristionchus pacificus TaxID=54126 RepID=A0A454XIA8_PRIPA|nr:atp-3 [Pristionchus pacificus]|eukprot:PDM63882.1 atp-3 [Pristionchus pacificus]